MYAQGDWISPENFGNRPLRDRVKYEHAMDVHCWDMNWSGIASDPKKCQNTIQL